MMIGGSAQRDYCISNGGRKFVGKERLLSVGLAVIQEQARQAQYPWTALTDTGSIYCIKRASSYFWQDVEQLSMNGHVDLVIIQYK